MRILSRYLLKQHLVPFVFALSALTAFQLVNQIARVPPKSSGTT